MWTTKRYGEELHIRLQGSAVPAVLSRSDISLRGMSEPVPIQMGVPSLAGAATRHGRIRDMSPCPHDGCLRHTSCSGLDEKASHGGDKRCLGARTWAQFLPSVWIRRSDAIGCGLGAFERSAKGVTTSISLYPITKRGIPSAVEGRKEEFFLESYGMNRACMDGVWESHLHRP